MFRLKYYLVGFILVITLVVSVYFIVARVRSSDGVVIGQKLVIDHDGGADDAMAIFMALLYEKYFHGPKVIALTTTHGNVHEDQSFINTQRILTIAKRTEVSIYRGRNSSLMIDVPSDVYFGKDGLGDNDYDEITPIEAQSLHAAIGIIELTKIYPGEITLVTLGPLTNVALAVGLDPTLLRRLAHLYIAAGHVHDAKHDTPEFNAEQDVEAYYTVMKNAYPEKVTILPFSQVATTNVTKEWRISVLGAIRTDVMKSLNEFERISIEYKDTWTLLDPIAMGVVLNEAIVGGTAYSRNSIHLCGENRGFNINNFTTMENANVKVIDNIIEEKFKSLLMLIFSAETTK